MKKEYKVNETKTNLQEIKQEVGILVKKNEEEITKEEEQEGFKNYIIIREEQQIHEQDRGCIALESE